MTSNGPVSTQKTSVAPKTASRGHARGGERWGAGSYQKRGGRGSAPPRAAELETQPRSFAFPGRQGLEADARVDVLPRARQEEQRALFEALDANCFPAGSHH